MADLRCWRVGVVDSCGLRHDARAAARFVATGNGVEATMPAADPTGHGTRLCGLLERGNDAVEIVLGQVFDMAGRTTAAVVAAAVIWCVEQDVHLIHLSLGLSADRECLASAIEQALRRGCVIVAAVPARGATTYPAAYRGVVRGTGDARCQPGEVSRLDETTFGGCPVGAGRSGGGASIGALQVTRALTLASAPCRTERALQALGAAALYHGRERRGRSAV